MTILDRVHHTSVTTGTGPYTLAGAVTGKQSLIDACNRAGIDPAGFRGPFYALPDDNSTAFESFIGTFDGSTQLARSKILRSTNGNAAVNWTGGVRNIILAPMADLLNRVANGIHCGLAGGTVNALAMTPDMPVVAEFEGLELHFTAAGSNTAAVTLNSNPDFFAADPVQLRGQALAGGEIVAGLSYTARRAGSTWQLIQREAQTSPPIARNSNTKLVAGDHDRDFILTGTFTQTFDPAATLGKGWIAYLRNDGTGIITLDPDGGELVNGLASLAVQPGQSCRVVCDGTGFKVFGLYASPGSVVDSTMATYTANADLTAIIPYDDSLPQIGEGTQILSAAITMKTATNKLRGRVTGSFCLSGIVGVFAAFANGASNAVGGDAVFPAGSAVPTDFGFEFEISPGSATTQTITVRAGPSSAGTMRLNGTTSARRLGGAARAALVLEEIPA